LLKVIPPGSYDFHEPAIQLVKRARAGLVGEDRRRLLKLAGHELVSAIDRLERRPDEELIRLIALGTTEHVGPNRNGDGFKAATCARTHDTFRKYARFYRGHRNTDPSKSYGIVPVSYFNEPMGRIELIAALNRTKSAADRNGGLVADKELEILESGRPLAVSMACSLNSNTRVLTADDYKRIGDVAVGDRVFTHRGRWRRVIAVNRRVYTGDAIRFSVEGNPTVFFMTADHLFRAKLVRGGKVPGEFAWTHAGHFEPGDVVEGVTTRTGARSAVVAKVEREYVKDAPTWNFEVEEDESYFLAGLASHNCKVSHDVCSACGNRAPTRRHYCTPDRCTKYGGCRDNLGKTFSDGHTLHVDNPDPTFFDISNVFRPADRIAYVLGRLEKAASAACGGAELADEMGLTLPAIPGLIGGRHERLAGIAAELSRGPGVKAAEAGCGAGIPIPDSVRADHRKLASALRALADARILLPVGGFVALVCGDPKKAEAAAPDVARRVPGALRALAVAGGGAFEANHFRAAGAASAPEAAWAGKLAADYSLDRAAVSRRAALAGIRGDAGIAREFSTLSEKAAAAADGLATQYAIYAVSAIDAMGGDDRAWLLEAASARIAASA